MKISKRIAIITACIAGILTGLGYFYKLKNYHEEILSRAQNTEVLAAARPIQIGEVFSEENIISIQVPSGNLQKRVVFPEDKRIIEGRRAFHFIPENEPILWSDLPQAPRVKYPTEKIPAGYRAFALPADEIYTLTHIINPGDRVDIVWTGFSSGSTNLTSDLLAENVRVIAVGDELDFISNEERQNAAPLSVTIAIKQDLAIRIAEALQTGQITFLARGRQLFEEKNDVVTNSDQNKNRGEK